MAKPLDNLDEIRDIASTLLKRADVADRLPTPVDDIVAASGLTEADDYVFDESKIRQAPRELRKFLRSAARKIRGALDRRERVLHVSPALDVPARRQFVRCHEVMHDALPWQRELTVLGDTDKTLAPTIELRFEREANQGGAELLFQVDLLARVARDYPTDITTPVVLAEMFGASIHSSFRRWIEGYPRPLCGLVLETQPVSTSPLTYRRFELVESNAWKEQFGTSRFPVRVGIVDHPFLASLASPWPTGIDEGWQYPDRNRDLVDVRVQSFCNTYRTFILVWPPSRESLVARHRARPRIEVR